VSRDARVNSAQSWLECLRCEHRAPVDQSGACTSCAGVLEVKYSAVENADAAALRSGSAEPGGIWRWRGLLPVLGAPDTLVSLGEGDTPLLRSSLDGREMWLKYEGKNPTHSFKDRFQAVSISAAAALGSQRVVCASTGNHGVAAAAYAARAGLQCVVLAHEEAPLAHLDAMRDFGALPVSVPPGERSALLARLVESGWYPSTTFWPFPKANPYGIEGYKTIAFELSEQLGGEAAARAHVFVPVGGGDSVYGIFKGFLELFRLGVLSRLPRMYACQPEGAAPLVAAQQHNADDVPHVEARPSLALSIREADTGNHALQAIRKSGGRAVGVADASIVSAVGRLANTGLAVDPASAASVAGALAALDQGLLGDDGPVVCVLTASGARWPRPDGWLPRGAQVAAGSADQAYRAIQALTD
jgi:threonine synthase